MKRNLLLLSYIIVFVAIILAGGYLYYRLSLDQVANAQGQTQEFEVLPGERVRDIASRLKSEGLIKNAVVYQVYIVERNVQSSLQAGKYELSPAMTIPDIVSALSSGEIIPQEKEITIIEGQTIEEIAEYLESEELFTKQEFISAATEFDYDFDFLADKPAQSSLQGYLFPDTYRVFIDSTPQDLIYKMLENFQNKVVAEVGSQGDEDLSFHEIITLASILEGEVKTDQDRQLVSDIFRRRIDADLPLQSCATLAFLIGKKDRYSLEDTETDSPYNTYQHLGLPPGPINNPSLSSIKAALNPEPNDYLYFLTASETGETIFSETLYEHNLAQEKYLD